MTAQYTIIYNDIYTITFEWWNDQYNILNSFIRTMSVYVYDNNGELILEDRNIVLLYYNIEHHNDLSKIKIHIDISINDYSVFSLLDPGLVAIAPLQDDDSSVSPSSPG